MSKNLYQVLFYSFERKLEVKRLFFVDLLHDCVVFSFYIQCGIFRVSTNRRFPGCVHFSFFSSHLKSCSHLVQILLTQSTKAISFLCFFNLFAGRV